MCKNKWQYQGPCNKCVSACAAPPPPAPSGGGGGMLSGLGGMVAQGEARQLASLVNYFLATLSTCKDARGI